MISFVGKTILITGANGAIGRATARLFRQLGAALVLTDLNEEDLIEFCRTLDPDGNWTVAVRLDSKSREDAQASVSLAISRFGGLDHIVTAAGFLQRKPFIEIDQQALSQTMAVNFFGIFDLCQVALPVMRSGGSFTHVVSLAAHTGRERSAHYAAAKSAVLGLTKSLAAELGPDFRANTVSPGFIDTSLAKPVINSFGPDFEKQIPLRRLGNVDEVAKAITFLASDWASYITGQTLHVNGGLYING